MNEIEGMIPDLMLDSYGNYMIQSLVNVCTVDQRYRILEQVIKFKRRKTKLNLLIFNILDSTKNLRNLKR